MRNIIKTIILSFAVIFIGCDKDIPYDNCDIIFPGLQMHQSMAFHDDKAVFVTPVGNNLVCDIYQISTHEFEAQVLLPFTGYSIPHANVSCFGRDRFTSQSIFPVLYVSSWNNQRQAFVYDITDRNGVIDSSLIQVIDPNSVSEDIVGGGYLDWVVDSEGGYLYAIAYHLKGTSRVSEGNYTHVTKFTLPPLTQQLVKLNDEDVLDNFSLPVMTVFQDKDYAGGHIYVVAGIPDESGQHPPRLYDINLESKNLKEYIIPITGEPEGFCIYAGQKWLNMGGSSKIHNLDKLLNL